MLVGDVVFFGCVRVEIIEFQAGALGVDEEFSAAVADRQVGTAVGFAARSEIRPLFQRAIGLVRPTLPRVDGPADRFALAFPRV